MKINFKNNSFQFFLIVSLSFHLIIILFMIVSKSLPDSFKKEKKLLIQNAIRIDAIGLPDIPSKPKAKNQPEKAISIQKTKKEKKPQKQKIIKRKNKKETQKDEKKKEKDLKNTTSDKQKKDTKGNKLSKGTKEETGELTAQKLSEINIYMSQVDSQIRSQWNLPKYLTDKSLTAQLEIKINEKGRIIYKQILISSGNELFDSFVLKAIENSEPYPSPPPDIQQLIKGGIVITLNSRD